MVKKRNINFTVLRRKTEMTRKRKRSLREEDGEGMRRKGGEVKVEEEGVKEGR